MIMAVLSGAEQNPYRARKARSAHKEKAEKAAQAASKASQAASKAPQVVELFGDGGHLHQTQIGVAEVIHADSARKALQAVELSPKGGSNQLSSEELAAAH